MRFFVAVFVVIVAAFSWNAATAFPDGAPWGAANPAAEQHCATCHFGAEPVIESAALVMEGLPSSPAPGGRYKLTVSFDDPQTVVAGFQMFAQLAEQQAGTFISSDADVEFIGSAIRSTMPAGSDDGVSWTIEWRAPVDIDSPIVFYLAASAANDDGSPFGDTIHFRTYRLAPD